MPVDPIICLDKVTKFYGHKLILKNISLDVLPGTLNIITGGNGAGKSTLMRLIAGLAKPTNGIIHIKDNIRLAYLAHATYLYPELTAWENLAFWAKTVKKKDIDKNLEDVLQRMALLPHAMVKSSLFSRGMAQRLNFARILLIDASLLLLDEPFSGVDQSSRKLMQTELIKFLNRGTAILMVSHDAAKDAFAAYHPLIIQDHKLQNVVSTVAQDREKY